MLLKGDHMNKKSMELSLNTVVVAIILLIVLIVLIFLFVTRSNIFGKSLEMSCTERGGTIAVSLPCDANHYLIYTKEKIDEKTTALKPCCVPAELKEP